MNILIVYSSKTGNTKRVAEAIAEELGTSAYSVADAPSTDGYDLVLTGYWVDRGAPNAEMKTYLSSLSAKRVALFATLGASPDTPHAKDSLDAGRALLPTGTECVGAFICQGKVDPALVEMMKSMFPQGHPHAMTAERLAGIDAASAHPNEDDLRRARDYFSKLVQNITDSL